MDGSGNTLQEPKTQMKSEKIDQAVEDFVSKISLTQSDIDRIESAYRGLTSYLGNHLSDDNNEAPRCYRQGSFENGTVIVPLDGGEYDVDIIVEYGSWPEDPDQALALLATTVKSHKTYSDKVSAKKSCIRVEYTDDSTGKFHVDLVPARPGAVGTKIEVPRKGDGWHVSDPKAYTAWCKAQGENFQKIVKIFKRWRDETENVKSSVKSIQLQVLVAEAMVELAVDLPISELVRRTFINLHENVDELEDNTPLWNPVLPEEDLASSWSATNRKHFKDSLDAAVEILQQIESAADEDAAFDLWRSLLGEDFPVPSDLEVETKSSTLHRLDPAARSWTVDSFEESLLLQVEVETHSTRTRPLKPHEQRALKSGRKLKFNLRKDSIPPHAEVWWQVTNTGTHARLVNQLRGDFIAAKARNLHSDSANQFEHWENTAYHGTHVVQAFVIVDGAVWGRSNEIDVRISNRDFWRRLRR
jgi:hypothetical protein